MNRSRIAALLLIPAASAGLLLGASGIAGAATPAPAPAAAPANFSTGAVNIDLTVTNTTDSPMTLTWSGLTGTVDHWDKRPLAILPAKSSEEITGYSHDLADELDMAMTYQSASGDIASVDVQADEWTGNNTTGTGATQADGQPATDLKTTASINSPGKFDYAVAAVVIDAIS